MISFMLFYMIIALIAIIIIATVLVTGGSFIIFFIPEFPLVGFPLMEFLKGEKFKNILQSIFTPETLANGKVEKIAVVLILLILVVAYIFVWRQFTRGFPRVSIAINALLGFGLSYAMFYTQFLAWYWGTGTRPLDQLELFNNPWANTILNFILFLLLGSAICLGRLRFFGGSGFITQQIIMRFVAWRHMRAVRAENSRRNGEYIDRVLRLRAQEAKQQSADSNELPQQED